MIVHKAKAHSTYLNEHQKEGKSIQIAGYNGVRTVLKVKINQIKCSRLLENFSIKSTNR